MAETDIIPEPKSWMQTVRHSKMDKMGANLEDVIHEELNVQALDINPRKSENKYSSVFLQHSQFKRSRSTIAENGTCISVSMKRCSTLDVFRFAYLSIKSQ